MPKKSARILKQTSTETLDKYLTRSASRKHKASEESTNMPVAKRQQFQIQNQWLPITASGTSSIYTRTLVPSPVCPTSEPPCHESMLEAGASQYRFRNIFISSLNSTSPLPSLKWGNPQDVWEVLKKKDQKYIRKADLLSLHPCIQNRMRAILLDWIIEVCEVYRLHRETFFLTVDYIDRFLSKVHDVQKKQLQLIGVTALFIAAKMEEIYPPKIADFAYVTDGACTESEISQQELIILKTLGWDLQPVTPNMWLCIYLQLLNDTTPANSETCFTKPRFSGHSFIQIVRLLDLCMLDIGSLQFSYSVLAAATLYHFSNETSTFKASGMQWEDISACVSWMAPFAVTVRDGGLVSLKVFDNVMREDCHNIQTHTVDLQMLDSAQARMESMNRSNASPEPQMSLPDSILTPPPSKHKH